MPDSVSKKIGKVIQIDEDQIRGHLGTISNLIYSEMDRTFSTFWENFLIKQVVS